MESLLQDVRYAARMLRKSPGFTAVAVITLALGIGANTSMFSTVNAMLLHPFPFPHLDRIVAVWETVPRQNEQRLVVAPANFLDWDAQNKSLDQLAAMHGWNVNLTGSGLAERVEAYQVTSKFFPLLGMSPEFGRSIGEADFAHGAAPVVVLSHGFWQRHLGGDGSIIGKTLLLNGARFTVIGVSRADMDFPPGAEAWTPLDTTGFPADRDNHFLMVVGRLKPGVSIPQAQADLEAVSARLAQIAPNTNAGHGARVVNLVEDFTIGSRQFVWALMGAAVFVLLLACANIANLQLARASTRDKEIAVRAALGAGRWQLARQLLVESVLLASFGGVAGVFLARWWLMVSQHMIPPFIVAHVAGLKHLEVDSRALMFTLCIALLTGILAGLAPSLHASRWEVNEVLKEGGRSATSNRGGRRLRTLLVISEVAFALVLLVGAGLMVSGFRNMVSSDLGFDRGHVLTFRISLSQIKYSDGDRVRNYYEQLVEKLRGLPGVESAASVTSAPASWDWNWTEYEPEGAAPLSPGELRDTISQTVTPEFFTTLRVPLLRGRLLAAQDGRDAAPVAVVSQSLADRVAPGASPIGKRLKLGGKDSHEPWRTIVGVVGNIRPSVFDLDPNPTTYLPLAQRPQASSAVVLRTQGNPLELAGAVRTQVQKLDPDQPSYDMRTQEQLISDDASGVEYSARMMLIFGVIALVLAAAGVYSVLSYSVAQRTHEIGVRVALGAQQFDVLRLIAISAGRMAGTGLLIGLGCTVLMTRLMSNALFGIVRFDLVIFVGLTLLLALVAALAAYVPARWAAKVDPMVALRYE